MVERICELILLSMVAFCRTTPGAERPEKVKPQWRSGLAGVPSTGKNALFAIAIRLATSLMPHSTKSADARRDTLPPATKTRRAMRPGLANVKSLALAVMARR
jgi:hypothetical protein